MTNVWCVRANAGEYTEHFLRGGYAAIGWREIAQDLGTVTSRDDLYSIVRTAYPDVDSPIVTGNIVGQVARFLLEIRAGDYVITPAADTEWLHHGQIAPDPSYVFAAGDDGCPYRHRRQVVWAKERLKRGDFSVPFQNTIRSSLTVFAVSQRDEFLAAIGRADAAAKTTAQYDPYRVVLEQAKVKVFVQAKRYKLGSKVNAGTVKQLRQAIPFGGQGAFITTADYQAAAAEVALETGFPRIGLINGRQLVDLLIEHWGDIPPEFQERLGLKPGLVRT